MLLLCYQQESQPWQVLPRPMLSLFVLRPSSSMKDYICGRNRHPKPNPTPDKVKSLYNAQRQFLVVQGQDKDLGTGSAIGVWGLCYPLQFQGLDDPSCVCLSFQLLCFVGFWPLKWTNMAVLALTLQNVPIQSFSSSDLLSI